MADAACEAVLNRSARWSGGRILGDLKLDRHLYHSTARHPLRRDDNLTSGPRSMNELQWAHGPP